MPYKVEYNKITVRSTEVFQRMVEVPTGELDDDGLPIMTHEAQWALRIKFIMRNDDGDRKGKEKIFSLSGPQESGIKNFMKPFIQQIKTDLDIAEGENWSNE